MVAPALLSLPRANVNRHALENFISTTQMLQDEVLTVNLQKPMVQPVLLLSPMAFLGVFGLRLNTLYLEVAILQTGLSRQLFLFVSRHPQMTLFTEQWLKIVVRDDLIACVKSTTQR